VPTSRRIAALLTAAALAVPATASAQTTTAPRGDSGVSTTPPVPLRERDGDRPRETAPAPPAPAAGELPDTGADPRLLFLCGFALTLVGAGLRLRTADADLY
jgi:hypothetical protein